MKTNRISLTLAAALALGLASCGKNESVTTTTDDANKAAASAAAAAAKTPEAAKAEAAKAADAAKAEAAKAEAAKAADNSKAQELIDKAKGLVAENKFADASSVLLQLARQSLSGEQQKLVDGLKEQIQKALAAKAVGAAGNLLKK